MPTVNIYTTSDGFVNDQDGGSPNGTSGNLTVGLTNPAMAACRTFMVFDVSSIPAGAVVSSATLNIYHNGQFGNGSTFDVEVGLASAAYSESTTNWGNQPGASPHTTFNVSTGTAFSWRSAAITSMVQSWQSSNTGLRLKSPIETTDATTASFHAREETNDPYVSVIYNTPPTQPGAFTVPAAGADYPVNVAISTAWGASTDPDGDAVTYSLYYKLNGGAETLIASGLSPASYSWTPTTGGSYQLVVYAAAAAQTSSSRTSGTFTVTAAQTHQMVI